MKPTYPIDYTEFVPINGTKLNLRVRGTKESNPVLLFLHGGPGVCDRHWVLADQSGLADICTLVCFDQRGAGKSYTRVQAKKKMDVALVIEDAREVVEYVCRRFHQEKVYIVGHSWGSFLGTLLAQKYPEHIAAYIGMGQLANGPENERISYAFVLDEAKKRNDQKALKDLARIGAPVNGLYRSIADLQVQRNYMTKYGGGSYREKETLIGSLVLPLLRSPEYTLMDLIRYSNGAYYNLGELWEEVATSDFMESVKKLDVPVWITQGRHDQNTPSELARKWYDALEAPEKDWIWFEESAHSPIKEEPERWGAVVREKLTAAEGKA